MRNHRPVSSTTQYCHIRQLGTRGAMAAQADTMTCNSPKTTLVHANCGERGTPSAQGAATNQAPIAAVIQLFQFNMKASVRKGVISNFSVRTTDYTFR